MTSHWIRWKAYLEIIQRKKLRYQNIFHHTLKPKIFIFTIKWKNFFLRLNETLLLIWNSFLNDSFPHFRKMQVFWYDTKLLKKCNRKKERCNQRVKKKFFLHTWEGHTERHFQIWFWRQALEWKSVECYILAQDVFTHEQFSF